MPILLDTSLLIAGERKGWNVWQVVDHVLSQAADENAAVSVVTLSELAHGAVRGDTVQRRALRRRFLDEAMLVLTVVPVSPSIAIRAGEIGGVLAAGGLSLGFADLLIGATALELGYRVATANVRHFRVIPGLEVVAF